MDKKLFQLVIILAIASLGYSILNTPGDSFKIDVSQLKALLLYVLLGGCVISILALFKRPPGV